MRRQAVEDNIRTHFHTFFIQERGRLAKHITTNIDPELLKKDDSSGNVDSVLNSYDWSNWQITIQSAAPYLAEAFANGSDDASSYLSIDLPGTDPKALEYAQERAGLLIGSGTDPTYALDETTRQMIRDTLIEQFERGPQSVPDLSSVIQDDYAFSESRATTIARTETGNAYNKGTVSRYRDAGIPKVYVFDGDHDGECREADGQIWDLDYAEEHLLQHPRCVRAFGPYIDDTEVDTS